ncbi:helix-turn-helix transcriptional regulator [Treponema sp.]|uniref:helix-turn-helix domain-containing protein n=1 Tax=Treponema sp. TaxID=166 RepID=UPI00298E817B|nr:helix-turn-helix transcriptional regulator [Treponema sp.]
MTLQETFISNLRKIRKEKRITQEKLAELCSTDTAYIGQIETNRRFPSIQMIEKIASALDVEPHTLFITESSENQEISSELTEEILKSIEPVIKKIIQEKISGH